ncbi:MAG: rod shape-determining protein MreD [Chloroflexi bacterium]|nr:rod shape-determining protein MreD [Chloroflexota bacterium]
MARRAGRPRFLSPATSRERTGVYPALIVLGLTVLIQATLSARLRFFGASPNLLLAIVVSWSMLRGFSQGILWGFIGGLGIDLVSGMPLGASSLALMSVCTLAGLGKSSVFAANVLLPMSIVALATPIHGWIILLTLQIQPALAGPGGVSVNWLDSTARIIAPELALNVLTIALLYPLLRRLSAALNAGRAE